MGKCKFCGCTDGHACLGGCSWIEKDVCSNCVIKLPSIGRELFAYLSDPETKEIIIEIIQKKSTTHLKVIK